jgi:hypothetical protein
MLTLLRKLPVPTCNTDALSLHKVSLGPTDDHGNFSLVSNAGVAFLRGLDPANDKLVISGETLAVLTDLLDAVHLLVGNDLALVRALIRVIDATKRAEAVVEPSPLCPANG